MYQYCPVLLIAAGFIPLPIVIPLVLLINPGLGMEAIETRSRVRLLLLEDVLRGEAIVDQALHFILLSCAAEVI